MAFVPAEARVPVAIGTMVVILKDAVGEETYQSAYFEVQVLDSDGEELERRRGDLRPHLTAGQIQGLLAFMDDLRTQAVSQIIG